MLAAMRRPYQLVFASVLLGALGTLAASTRSSDPLAAEIARWSQYLKSNTSQDEMWLQIKEGSDAAMARVESAMKDGRRLLALQRLAAVGPNLASAEYLASLTAEQRKSDADFEAAWKSAGRELGAEIAAPSPKAFDGVAPAAVRGVGEASLAQVRVFYDASLEYERNTMPDAGYFYLGLAKAQSDFAGFCRTLSKPSGLRPPPLRSVAPELDALEGELLAAYRPPASIDRHSDFIAASAALKEARELDAAGAPLRGHASVSAGRAALRAADGPGARHDERPGRTEARRSRAAPGGPRRRRRPEPRPHLPGVGPGGRRGFDGVGRAAGPGFGRAHERAAALLRRSGAREGRSARPRAGGHRHARPVAVHLKPL